ncbi:MAG: aminopeptidase, partial [Deltaproteobacteria bacterium]|nr:aminopeptidase [Deltaproteobacteria bacterium]
KVKEYLNIDSEASVIGELGIGLNPGARLVGNLLEDEKAFKTAHIAFGNNEDMPGGRNRSKTHRDFLFREPTFVVKYKDGSEKVLIENGFVNL